MDKTSDNIKVLFEKARGGDLKELKLLTGAFTRWLRLSFEEEVNQPLGSQLLEKFLDNLSKVIRKIEKIEGLIWKTKAVETLSRLMETIYTTRNLEPAVTHLESMLYEFEGISEDQTLVKRLEDITSLLAELPSQTTVESPPENNRKLSQIRKKRGGCTDSSGPTGGTKTIDKFMNDMIKDVIANKIEDTIKDGINEMFDQVKGRIKGKTPEEMLKEKIEKNAPETKDKIKEILGPLKGKMKIDAIDNSKREEAGGFIKDQINELVEKESPVTFSVYWQHYVIPKEWTNLMVYLYSGSHGDEETYENLLKQVKNPDKFDFNISGPVDIKWGAKILIKPEMPGFRFSPEESLVTWYEDWIPVTFNIMAEPKESISNRGEKVDGKVKFFVGPLLINEIDFDVTIKKHLSGDEIFTINKKAQPAYLKIFPSYAHEDEDIVEKIEAAVETLGNKYMRDVKVIRSGEEFGPAIDDLIKEANIFQLFWSEASKKSEYVEKEWRAALDRKKEYFIRPTYWKKPMPNPPTELDKIHFSYIKKAILISGD